MINSTQKTFVYFIISTLKNHPMDWKFDGHVARNAKLDVSIWYATGCAFLAVYDGNWMDRNHLVGDESCHMFGWWVSWRRQLMRALRKAKDYQTRSRFKELENKVYQRVMARMNPNHPDSVILNE